MPGMRDSDWATGRNGRSLRRGGYWNCYTCGTSIPLSQRSCPQCNPVSNGTYSDSSNMIGVDHPQARDLHQPAAATNLCQLSDGLAMSRWAPRRGSRREVWTKTISKPSASVPRASYEPSLDLPYQVQHYILGMMQRMLEEACYEYAARWAPETLIARGLDCSEAVELSTWKSFLPTAIPTQAITSVPNYTLAAALADAVRLRNRAVHRHLCETTEIRTMALKCKDLMVMFSDTTRQEKFHLLWVALGHWEMEGKAEPTSARARLEESLKNIGERPVDDMDWSPNSISLQELAGNAQREEIFDAMELD